MRLRLALVFAALMVGVGQGWASGKFQYGSRAGMEVDVVSMSGLDTAHAIMRTRHTRENAIAFCRDYAQHITAECIKSELDVRLNDEVTADCDSGLFSNFFGKQYRFTGPLKKTDDFQMAHFGIVDVASGEIADGSNASGYTINMLIFKALCPRRAPEESEF